jgi:AcrR family transcriptional regulator
MMPKRFTDSEKEYIIKRLKEEAMKCLKMYGVKKTTVDELVKRVNIPKGTFYLFYESKEELLFAAIDEIHMKMHEGLFKEMAGLGQEITVDALTDFLVRVYKEVNNTGLLPMILNGEMDYLMRRLPEKLIKEHMEEDNLSVEKLFEYLPYKGNKNVEAFSAAFRGVFLIMQYKTVLGEENFDEAMKIMLRGLVIQLMEDEDHD